MKGDDVISALERAMCRLFGHRYYSYIVTWSTPEGDPQIYMNHMCVRCLRPRNPEIYAAQRAMIDYYGGTQVIETGVLVRNLGIADTAVAVRPRP